MFHEVHFADWSAFVAVMAFAVSAAVFGFFLVGALRTPRAKIERDAALPFRKEKTL